MVDILVLFQTLMGVLLVFPVKSRQVKKIEINILITLGKHPLLATSAIANSFGEPNSCVCLSPPYSTRIPPLKGTESHWILHLGQRPGSLVMRSSVQQIKIGFP